MNLRIIFLHNEQASLHDLKQAFSNVLENTSLMESVDSPKKLVQKIDAGLSFDLIVITSISNPPKSELKTISDIREIDPVIPIVLVADQGGVDIAQQTVQAGATDFMVKGDHLEARIQTVLGKLQHIFHLIQRNRILKEQNRLFREAEQVRFQMVGSSPVIKKIREQITRIAKIPRPVLITGERGTGKELVARAIHLLGRPGYPWVVVNCAAFPENLLESELFGYEKGAFTGAANIKIGKFEQAGNGTLFLDEIGNMSLTFQQKILRAIEYGHFSRLGGAKDIQVNTRIIAATNADLQTKMSKGEFLRDLYDRLSFEIINVPPLRERKEDIEILARSFLNQFMEEIPAFQGKLLSETAIKVLSEYDFPGNIRELKNIIERAAYRDVTNEITPEDIGFLSPDEALIEGCTFMEKVENFKKNLIIHALENSGRNQAKAARILGINYHQFRHYYQKYLR